VRTEEFIYFEDPSVLPGFLQQSAVMLLPAPGSGYLEGDELGNQSGLTEIGTALDLSRYRREEFVNRVFKIQEGIKVPDGTTVYPFLNSKDASSNLRWDLLEGFSMAGGDIDPHSQSKIHVMPLVTQVTMLLEGDLTIRMKDSSVPRTYDILLAPQQAVLTQPGTFFQLINPTPSRCRALYVVSPAYLFDISEDGRVLYDDAIVLDEDWEELARMGWEPLALQAAPAMTESRIAATASVARKKAHLSTG
jgi:hypothetical protein